MQYSPATRRTGNTAIYDELRISQRAQPRGERERHGQAVRQAHDNVADNLGRFKVFFEVAVRGVLVRGAARGIRIKLADEGCHDYWEG